MENNYGDCNFCGAKKVKNPKTGKIFCSEKCWLKGDNQPKPLPKPQNAPTTHLNQGSDQSLEQRVDLLINEVKTLIDLVREQIGL